MQVEEDAPTLLCLPVDGGRRELTTSAKDRAVHAGTPRDDTLLLASSPPEELGIPRIAELRLEHQTAAAESVAASGTHKSAAQDTNGILRLS
ncbi:hypothetical protein MUK42_06559 [Musa troglodytarum]|uniref:Uncharacterized protein n=1 Tax=Musa troglodytarum TaxID=320322 RepID=A0A9E7GEK8_9LILI|nr:hypothetical protein MUK42_06559 [Musa troglodytarum]